MNSQTRSKNSSKNLILENIQDEIKKEAEEPTMNGTSIRLVDR